MVMPLSLFKEKIKKNRLTEVFPLTYLLQIKKAFNMEQYNSK